MAIYICMTIIAVLFSALSNIKEEKIKNKNNKINFKIAFWYLSEITLILVAAIRYKVGQDYMYTYVPVFKSILHGNTRTDIEIGFCLLNKFVQLFTDDYAGIFVLSSVIFFHYIYKAIREQSEIPTLSVFLLVGTTYYFIFLNTMRQMIAISIFFYAIKFIKERNFKKYLLYLLAASTMHISVLILLPIYFLYGIKVKPEKSLIILIICICLKPIFVKYMLIIMMQTKYYIYINSRFDINETGYIVMAINLCILFFAYIYYKRNISKENNIEVSKIENYSFYSNLQLISTIISIYDGSLPLLNRVRWATGITIIILIPLIIKQERNIKTRMLYIGIIVLLYCIYSFYTIGIKNSNNVLPYLTIFQR